MAVIGAGFVLRSALLREWGWLRRGWVPAALAWWGWLVLCSAPAGWDALGQALGLRTVGEGVETAEQRDALAAIGCTYGQGYLFSRPLALPELVAWLRESPRPGAT